MHANGASNAGAAEPPVEEWEVDLGATLSGERFAQQASKITPPDAEVTRAMPSQALTEKAAPAEDSATRVAPPRVEMSKPVEDSATRIRISSPDLAPASEPDPLGETMAGPSPIVVAPPPPPPPPPVPQPNAMLRSQPGLPPPTGAEALKRSSPGMPAVPAPGALTRSSPGMPAVPPPGALTRSSPGMPAVPAPGALTRSSPGMPAVPPPGALTRSSPGMPAVPAPGALTRSSPGMPAIAPPGRMIAETLPDPNAGAPLLDTIQDSPSWDERFSAPPTITNPGPIAYSPGDVIGGKYRLAQMIGKGGMGAVWLARNLALDVDVAVKLIRHDRASQEAAARLLTEARAAAKLGHPGIVRVFDFGQTEVGDPYFVMELLSGESLSNILARKGRLEPGVAIQTLLPVAAALAAAHAKGIVHRDLKPDNVMLVNDETGKIVPKVLDFGIARVMRDDVERHVTIAGEVLGSPDYMSPEQARGEVDVDHRTDIWTFSVLLYETITGKRPFGGPNYNALIAAIITAAPVPITSYGVGDAALWNILERGLAKDLNARWPTVRDMGIALATWASERGLVQDISGMSLKTEWLAPKMRRLFTVQPPDPSALAAGLPQQVQVPITNAGAPPVSASVAPAEAEWKNLRGGSSRRIWMALAALVVLGVVAFFARGPIGELLSPAPAAPSASASAAPTPPTTAAPSSATAPTTDPSAPHTAASSGAKPQPQPVRSSGTRTQKKATPPPVPRNIKF